MKRTRRKSTLTQKGAYLKTRIARNRGRAQFVGIVYFLSIIALAAAACLPLFDLTKQTLAPIGVLEFWKQFMPANFKALNSVEAILKVANAALYALMLLGVVINVLRALGKLGWLFKKKASKTYGFNRNVYAMEDLGSIFSGSYAVILSTYFLIAVLCGAAHPNMLMLIVLGGVVFVHLVAGFIGGKASYFDIEGGEIIEDKRVVGRFSALFRNVLQLAAVFAILFFFLQVNTIHTVIGPLLEKNGIKNYVLGQPLAYISIALQVLTVVCVLPLIKHATAITEYNIDGANGSGMKTFRVFAFFVFLTAGATALCAYLFGEVVFTKVDAGTTVSVMKYLDLGSIIIAGIALVMFIIEVIMRNMPGHKKAKKKAKDEEVEADYDAVSPAKPVPHPSSPYVNMPLYIMLDTKERTASASVVEEQKEEEPEEEPEEEEVVEESYTVNCPHCGKLLRVKSGPEYHRCPACSKVFQIRKVTK